MERFDVMKSATINRSSFAATDDYLQLVKEFPIRPIKTAKEFAVAQSILDRLVGREDLTPGQRDYVSAIARFMQDYDRPRRSGLGDRSTPLEILKFLMEENSMSTTDLGKIVGSRGLASEILNRKRGLSKAVIGRLAARFKVDPG